MPYHTGIKRKTARLKPFSASRVAGIKHRHIVFLCHAVYRAEQTFKVLFGVDVLLAVSREKDVPPALKPETGENVALFDVGKVRVKHLRHRRTGDIGALLRQTALGKIPPRVLGVCHVDVGNYIDDPAVGLLRKALVLAAVAGFHVEDRNVQPLCRDRRQAGVRVAEDKHCVRLYLRHQLV